MCEAREFWDQVVEDAMPEDLEVDTKKTVASGFTFTAAAGLIGAAGFGLHRW